MSPDEWDKQGLIDNLNTQFPLNRYTEGEDLTLLERPELSARLHEIADQAYEDREAEFGPEVMRDIERWIAIRQIDQAWIYHLANMDYLREGIGLRGYAQMDPLVAYKKEALELFDEMQGGIQGDIVRDLFFMPLQVVPQDMEPESMFNVTGEFGPDDMEMLMGGTDDPSGLLAAPGNLPAAPRIPDVGQSVLLQAAAASAQQQQNGGADTAGRVGPNDPCPCGSGKKYKKCCRNKA